MNALIVAIPQSMNHFHGDHWYHIGEHFFGRRNELSTICHLCAECTNLILMTHCPFLHIMMTSLTLFLAYLSFQCPGLQQIQLVKPVGSMPLVQINTTVTFAGYNTRSFSFVNISEQVYHKHDLLKSKDAESYAGFYALSMDTTPISTAVWFNRSEEAFTLRQRLSTLCSRHKKDNHLDMSAKKHHLLIYERDQNRRLTNLNSIVNIVATDGILSELWENTVMKHDDNRMPCDLYQTFQRVDVLVTTHGFQLTGTFYLSKLLSFQIVILSLFLLIIAVIFLRPDTLVVEIFPYKYFKPSYFPLYSALDLKHLWFQSARVSSRYLQGMSLEACMKNKACRSFARHQDIYLESKEVNLIRSALLQHSLVIA